MAVTLAPLSAADLAAIESIHSSFSAALLRQDFDSLAALYTHDAAFMPPHQPAVNGRAALKTWMAGFPRVTRFLLYLDRVDGRADLAYVRGRYDMTIHPDGAPAPATDNGKYIEILRRHPDGGWLLEADIFNSDNP